MAKNHKRSDIDGLVGVGLGFSLSVISFSCRRTEEELKIERNSASWLMLIGYIGKGKGRSNKSLNFFLVAN